MRYTIKTADITDPAIDFTIRHLIKAAYHAADLLPEKFLASNIQSNASKQSIFLVAEENGDIIGCNAFMANDFTLDGMQYVGYQSCWSVTHPGHQGRGVFSGLINVAKQMLQAEGAGFIFGIANNRSNPVITERLGFVETPSQVVRIPNIGFIRNFYFTNKVSHNNNACLINEQQVLEHKQMQKPSVIKTVHYNNSWLWGKVESKNKYGIQWPVFFAGGVVLADEKDLKMLVSKIFELYKVSFVQFFSCKTNTFNDLLRGWKKPNMNGFIFFNLNMPRFTHFNCMLGAIDIF